MRGIKPPDGLAGTGKRELREREGERERDGADGKSREGLDGDNDARAPTRCLGPVRNLSTPEAA